MTLPRNVSLTGGAVSSVDLSADVSPHRLIRVQVGGAAPLTWITTSGATPAAYANDNETNWLCPDDPGSADSIVLEVPESRLIKILAPTTTVAQIDLVPGAVSPRSLNQGLGLNARVRYPTLSYGGVTSVDTTAIQPTDRWLRLDLPTIATAWCTLDGSTPSSGVGTVTNAFGQQSHAVQAPVGGTLKVWLDAGTGTTRMRVTAIAEPDPRHWAA